MRTPFSVVVRLAHPSDPDARIARASVRVVTVITDTDAGQIAALESRAWKKLKANKGALVGVGRRRF
mgnify:CR=1 FL=1